MGHPVGGGPDTWAGAVKQVSPRHRHAALVEMTEWWWESQEQQIPFGDDRKKSNGKSKGGNDGEGHSHNCGYSKAMARRMRNASLLPQCLHRVDGSRTTRGDEACDGRYTYQHRND